MNFQAFKRFLDLSPASAAAQLVVQVEEQNSDYESGVARIGKEQWRIRTARITPTKPGAFVALWKRGDDGSTRPFTADESLSGLLVFVEEDQQRFGVFQFTKAHLIALGYVRSIKYPARAGGCVLRVSLEVTRCGGAEAPQMDSASGILRSS